MRISDWSSDVCSSDLLGAAALDLEAAARGNLQGDAVGRGAEGADLRQAGGVDSREVELRRPVEQQPDAPRSLPLGRSEERRVGKEWVRTFRSRGSPYT